MKGAIMTNRNRITQILAKEGIAAADELLRAWGRRNARRRNTRKAKLLMPGGQVITQRFPIDKDGWIDPNILPEGALEIVRTAQNIRLEKKVDRDGNPKSEYVETETNITKEYVSRPILLIADGSRSHQRGELIDGFGKKFPPLPKGAIDVSPQAMAFYRSHFDAAPGGKLPAPMQSAQNVYDAVGRIGVRQNGIPRGDDIMFGTGILVSPKHILTNSHVWNFISRRSEPKNFRDIGIEFGAEYRSDKSDFVGFKRKKPFFINGYDAVISELRKAVTSRPVASFYDGPIEDLLDVSGKLDALVIGYPGTEFKSRRNLILGTKRYSQGKVFNHSTDQDDSFEMPVKAHSSVGRNVEMQVIAHDASTLGGHSGSPVISLGAQAGKVIGLHFSRYLGDGEDANLAIPSHSLVDAINEIVNQ